ncbi:hypothetical protein JOM56_010701 [Amanita muscaria]
MLRKGKENHVCGMCNRPFKKNELGDFEKHVKKLIQEGNEDKTKNDDADEELLGQWEEELEQFQKLLPFQAVRDQVRLKDIPALEDQIKQQGDMLPKLIGGAEEAQDRLDKVKREIKDIQALKQQATTISRLQREIDRARQEVNSLELDLASSGSTKTPEDVHTELEEISATLERHNLMQERDRQLGALRAQESALHQMELNERDMSNKLREKAKLEEQIATFRTDVSTFTARLKDTEAMIVEAQVPIDALDEEFKQVESELGARIAQAQALSQELNISVDKLNQMNKGVDRYIKERRARELENCSEMIEQTDAMIQDFGEKIENVRTTMAKIEKEINESGSSIANLRENLRLRKIEKEIRKTQEQIAAFDMEEAAKAKRNFESKWDIVKKKEDELKAGYSHIEGELVSLKNQLKSLESDFREFKDIAKKYTDQLIKVKVRI